VSCPHLCSKTDIVFKIHKPARPLRCLYCDFEPSTNDVYYSHGYWVALRWKYVFFWNWKGRKREPFDVSISFSWLILRPDVILMLENTGPHNTTNAKGEVTLRIWTEDMRDASTVAAVDAIELYTTSSKTNYLRQGLWMP